MMKTLIRRAIRLSRNNGPHGLTEMLYAYTSAVGNNGSAFAGINANTPYFNATMGLALGCSLAFPSLAIWTPHTRVSFIVCLDALSVIPV